MTSPGEDLIVPGHRPTRRARLTNLDYPRTVGHMEKAVNIHEAKTHLSRLIERVEAGEEITIARAGRPVAKLVPLTRRTEPRPLGLWKGKVVIKPDFDDPLPDFDDAFG